MNLYIKMNCMIQNADVNTPRTPNASNSGMVNVLFVMRHQNLDCAAK